MERSLLNDATSTDDNPTPGYMLNEIARATTANYAANVQLQDFLVSRLTHKSHNVKWKCLIIIKHVCRAGRPEFKKEMARKVEPIKECIQYRGTPDPIRGDELNKRVRDAAKEALDAIFDSQMPVTTSAVAAANRIQGMGNDYVPDSKPKESTGVISSIVSGIQNTIMKDSSESSYVGNHGATGSFQTQSSRYNGPSSSGYDGGSGKYSSSGMVGIGNPNYKDAREEKSWMQKASEAAQALTGSNSSSATSASGPIRGSTGTSDYNYATNRGANAYGMNDPAYNPRPVNAFGGASSNVYGPGSSSALASVSNSVMAAATSNGSLVGRAGSAVTDGTYEKAMIDSLCEPGGLKPVPPEDKLSGFLTAAPTLSPDIVGNCLADNLLSEAWQTRTKSLLVICALVKGAGCQAHADWWISNAEEIRNLLQDSKPTVRSQAAKTLRAVGAEVVGVAEDAGNRRSRSPMNTHAATANVDTTKSVSLLDDFDSEPSMPSVATSSANPSMGLFADVQITSSTAPAPNAGGLSSMFDGLSLGQSTAPVATPINCSAATNQVPVNATSSAFDFLDMGTAPMPPIAPTTTYSAPSSSLPPLSTSPIPPFGSALTGTASTFSVFDNLDNTPLSTSATVPVSTGPSNYSPAVPSDSSSSGFSFFSAPTAKPADVISAAFVNPANIDKQREDAANASFAALSATYGLSSSSSKPVNNGVNMSAPIGVANSQRSPNYATSAYNNTGYGMPVPGAGMGYPSPTMSSNGMGMYNPNVSPLAPSMLAHNAPRKSIPDADNSAAASSGFSFMGASSTSNSSRGGPNGKPATANDSFDFVNQAMKGSR